MREFVDQYKLQIYTHNDPHPNIDTSSLSCTPLCAGSPERTTSLASGNVCGSVCANVFAFCR